MPTLTWLTRNVDIRLAQKVPYRLLESVQDLSYGDEQTENMLIQGDNLEALKALLPYYTGRIKCIYIDPPFNTEQAFEHYDDNLEHSIWLAILYPRLELLRNLLVEEGTLFVHIDDSEMPYLIVVLDEIFGRRNRISLVTLLGEAVFDETGRINPSIRFATLAAHIWFCETKTPLGKQAATPLLGIHNETAYYLLFNGILGDKRPDGGNVLTSKVLKSLPSCEGPKVIYGETTRLGTERLRSEGIIFKQIPYDIKAR